MNRNLKRLALAFVISASCFGATVIWFESGKTAAAHGDRAPIARLNESSNDVQRKPLKRVIWESVSKNDDLYPGEAIRTTENAEAKIQLVKSGAVIHLEANSLVVLEENENGMSLDFLQGNLFVSSSGGGGGDGLTLKMGSDEVKLNSADLSLSKGSDGKVDLAVFKGQAEMQKDGKTVSIDKDKMVSVTDKGVSVDKDRVQILWPVAGETVLLNLVHGERLDVAFKPLPKGYVVTAEWGAKRSNLKPAGVSAPGESGKISIGGRSGKWFVKLSAKSEDPALPPLASNVLPLAIDPKSPPALVEPKGGAPVIKESAAAPVAFRWLNRHKLESQILEIATDAQFKNLKTKQTFDGETGDFSAADLGDGTYYWRVTGFLKIKDKTEALSSAPSKFSVVSSWELKAPTPVWPEANQRLSYIDAQKSGVSFKWSAPAGVKRYTVLVQRKGVTILEKELETTMVKITDVKPGNYQWKVSSLDPKGGAPKATPVMNFTIDEMPKLEWAENPAVYEYPTPTPSLRAQWKPLASAASYRFRLENKDLANGQPEWQSTKQSVFDVPLAADGQYEAVVEALNEKGQTIAQSDARTFGVKRRPLLPAPQWGQNSPDIFKSDAKGNLSFGWEEVEGAKHYLMILESEDGKVVEKKEVSRTTASFSRLRPGQYKVRLKSVDVLQRPSEESSQKDLFVPAISDIKAPKIKNMKVK
jgi:hypothetical protein